MIFNVIFKSTRSITIELQNSDIVVTKPYSVFIDNELYASDVTSNVFSLYNLEPSTKYNITVKGEGEYTTEVETEFEFVTLNVKKFGAKGDGTTIDTNAIQGCIMACPDNGRVYFPEGDYYTGPLFLRSNITIELAKGARLVGDIDRNNYPILPCVIYKID